MFKHKEFDSHIHKYSYYLSAVCSNIILGTIVFLAQYFILTPIFPSLNTVHIFGMAIHVPIFLAITIILLVKTNQELNLYELFNEEKKKF